MSENKNSWSEFLLPGAIVLAGMLIAGALVYPSLGDGLKQIGQVGPEAADNEVEAGDFSKVGAVTAEDHIFGSKNAKVKIVEFSDFQCPFCRRFGETMKQVIADYNGEVAWVYRHFPLESMHPYAKKAAQASECAAELGGNSKFWEFADKFAELTENSEPTDATITQAAAAIGLNQTAFSQCLASGKYDQKIASQVQDGTTAGCQGTPYSVIIVDGRPETTIGGALPIDQVKQAIDEVLK
jgi:protein-disulfide isomerase